MKESTTSECKQSCLPRIAPSDVVSTRSAHQLVAVQNQLYVDMKAVGRGHCEPKTPCTVKDPVWC